MDSVSFSPSVTPATQTRDTRPLPESAPTAPAPMFVTRASSTQATAYRAQLSQDLDQVQKLGPAPIPREVEVQIPLKGHSEILKAQISPNGEFRGKPAYECLGVSFVTYALGISCPVYCSIIANIERGTPNPSALIARAVIQHVQSVAASNLEALGKLPQSYTVKRGSKDELSIGTGYPEKTEYRRPDGMTPPELYTKLKSGAIVPGNGQDRVILLSSGQRVHTTEQRLAQARELAKRITQVVADDGSRRPAAAGQVEKVAHRLAGLSAADMKAIAENGYKILLVNTSKTPRGGYAGGRAGAELAKDGSWQPGVRGYVSYESKVLVLPADALDEALRGADVLMHELGHVVSDCRAKDSKPESYLFGLITFSGKVNSLDTDPAIKGLFEAYAKRCGYDTSKGRGGTITNSSAAWSTYAVEGQQEYIAEGLAFYKGNKQTRQKLRSLDPAFFTKLQQMFPEDANR